MLIFTKGYYGQEVVESHDYFERIKYTEEDVSLSHTLFIRRTFSFSHIFVCSSPRSSAVFFCIKKI